MSIILILALSLSMDAFSLALIYGTLNIDKKDIYVLSIIVGLFHFFMPIMGNFIGCSFILKYIHNANILVFIILSFIGVEMLFDSFKNDKKVKKMQVINMFLFCFAVSKDSFSVGIGINSIYNNIIYSSSIIALCAYTLTFIGLNAGKKINGIVGSLSTIIGGIILIIMGIAYLF